jgi:hypothetical protein
VSRTEAFVGTDWAEARLTDPTVGSGEDVSAHDAGHLTGAFRLAWHTELLRQGVPGAPSTAPRSSSSVGHGRRQRPDRCASRQHLQCASLPDMPVHDPQTAV